MKKIFFYIILFSIQIYCHHQIYIPDGELIEGFENLNGWNLIGTSVYDSLDEVHYTEGFYSLKLGSSVNERAIMTKGISINFNKYESFSIDLYIPDFSSNINNYIRIEFTSSNFYDNTLRTYLYAGERLFTGWNRLVFSKADFISYGSEKWTNTMDSIKITETTSIDGIISPGYLTLDNFRGYEKKAEPIAIITFDDNWKDNMDFAKPILDSLGFKAVEFVIGKTASQTQPNRLHWSELDSLYKDGWDISNHTYTHPHLSKIPLDSLDFEINGMRDTLIAHGYTKSCDFFAYPFGDFNLNVLKKVKEKNKFARNSGDWQYLTHPTRRIDDFYLLREHSQIDSLTQQYSDIDKAISRGQLLIYLFHEIKSYVGKFSSIMHYLKIKQDLGLIKVMTMSQYWDYLNSSTSVNKNNINFNLKFSLEQNYPNPFNPNTKI